MTIILNKNFLFLVFSFFATLYSFAQQGLGFCEGNSGDPIFVEDFGQGIQNGPPLPESVTSYEFVNQGPEDGQYTISSNLFQLDGFHNTTDHTGNENGKALIVNADFEPGLFYEIVVDGLCINNTYEFSAFLMNIYNTNTNFCDNNGIPVNVKFQIWDETDTDLLAEGDTGDIEGTSSPIWRQFGLTFTTLSGQDSVILKMLNNGEGGCGNDLAIDDIVFKSCGDFTEITSETGATSFQICENETVNDFTLEANPDFSVYDSHSYQWQSSEDGDNWTNLSGETNNQLVIPELSGNRLYRALVAEDPININNSSCNSISTTFEVQTLEFIDPMSQGDVFVCDGEAESISVETNPDISVNWYDSEIGGNLLEEDTYEFQPENNGTFYAEATTINGSCTNPNRVSVQYSVFETPELFDEIIEICEGESLTLSENFENVNYLWSTGETGSSIIVNDSGIYTLELSTPDNCLVSKDFTVETISAPVIADISKIENSLVIETASEGDFSYSIDGSNYQNQPIFNNLSGGLYTVYVLENKGCGLVSEEFLYLFIPEFFTPNADQINDTFKIEGDIFFDEFEIIIFDRYGKVLARGNNAPFEWNGTYNGKNMPEDDYWYRIKIDNKIYKGNISLIR